MRSASRLWVLLALGLLAGSAAIWSMLPPRRAPVEDKPGAAPPLPPPVDDETAQRAEVAIQRAIEYCMSRQSPDGSWRSDTYGTMKGGGAITALVVYGLSHAPPRLRAAYESQVRRALEFLTQDVAKRGYVADPDGSSEFPTYATAMTLVAAEKLKFELPAADRQAMLRYLIDAQLKEAQGFKPDSPHHGGWDMVGGRAALAVGETPGTNISVTCFALEALSGAPEPASKQALQRSSRWLRGCQNLAGDGGFVFTPLKAEPSNKAGWADATRAEPRSYATTTGDGLRALFYCGLDRADPRVSAAQRWLAEHDELSVVPGFEQLPEESPNWREGLRFYYYFTLAKDLQLLPADLARKQSSGLVAVLVPLQKEDGRFENGWPPPMREDDPLIATPLAIVALAEAWAGLGTGQ